MLALMETGADDAALLRHGGFAAVYARHAGEILLYARALSGDDAFAEDLVQEAFLRLLECDPARLGGSARGFLVTVVRNRLRDESRRREVRRRSAPLLAPAEGAQPARTAGEVTAALDRLPEEQREAVVLRIWGGFTFGQIAEITAAPEGTVLSRYRYAIEKLGELLSEETR